MHLVTYLDSYFRLDWSRKKMLQWTELLYDDFLLADAETQPTWTMSKSSNNDWYFQNLSKTFTVLSTTTSANLQYHHIHNFWITSTL